MRRMIIMGAGGRDFHDFNTVFRDDPDTEVVGFTAAQIPGIAGRTYPSSLAGPRYPGGIPIYPEDELGGLIRDQGVGEVVFAYSDVSYEHVMHRAAIVLAAGADFSLLGPEATMLRSEKPVVSVCAVRTGAGKSQTSRYICGVLLAAGVRPVLLRHPMPYHDLEAMRVQRFATIDDIDASHPTIEEREEYELPVRHGIVVFAGVDYGEIVRQAEREADVIVWDGGNNDLPFVRPDLHVVVVDPLRSEGLRFHPGEANLRMANVVLVNKVDSASHDQVREVLDDVAAVNPDAAIVRAASPVVLGDGPSLEGKAVLVVEDGPTVTHGGMPFGAGTVAARQAGVRVQVDPRPYAVGSIADTFRRYPHIGPVLPAMGYSDEQLGELAATIDATECDVVVTGTPIELGRLMSSRHPIRHATYDLQELGEPRLEKFLAPLIAAGRRR